MFDDDNGWCYPSVEISNRLPQVWQCSYMCDNFSVTVV